jgi:hypothetical protein
MDGAKAMTDKLTLEELEWFDSVEPPSSWCKSDMWERLIAAAHASVEQPLWHGHLRQTPFLPNTGDAQEREEGMSELQRLGQEFDAAPLPKSEGEYDPDDIDWLRKKFVERSDALAECRAANAKLVEEVERFKDNTLLANSWEDNNRLRAENERLKAACEGHLQNAANIRGNLSAENERLREALEKIGRASYTDPFRTFDGMIQDMQMIDDIASAALEKVK